jgi:hypothetical protein
MFELLGVQKHCLFLSTRNVIRYSNETSWTSSSNIKIQPVHKSLFKRQQVDNYSLSIFRTFGPSDGCRSLHTKKTRQYFHEPEPSFVMVMVRSA